MFPFLLPSLGCLGAQALSCFSSAACFCTCQLLSLSGSTSTRIMYALVFLLNSTFAWLMLTDWAAQRLQEWTYGYLHLECPSGECYGILAVHRWCFALTLFHAVNGLLVLGVESSKEPRAAIQNGWWGPKVVLWLGLVVLAFFIPNGFFEVWGNYVSLVGSTLFILIQLVLLVDLAHHWCELCLERWETRGETKWQWLLVGSSGGLFLFTAVGTILLYLFFAGTGCSLNQFLVTVNLLVALVVSVLAVHPAVQEANAKSGLAQAAMVTAYATYLIASALINEPTPADDAGGEGDLGMCNPLARSRSTRTTAVAIGAIFTIVAIVYSTSRAATQGRSLIHNADYDEENASSAVPLLSSDYAMSDGDGVRNQALIDAVASGALPASALQQPSRESAGRRRRLDDEKYGVTYNYTFFHFIFAMAAMYVAMLLTSWNTVDIGDSGELTIIGRSMAAVWAKVLSSWLAMGLYAWTLVGPLILPDREWA
ncbi:serine incorporator/TMS membrane protein [Dimargaris cristalligena]|uniref:Serine incorporator/TMS membrane protein n=1 Tax=Dimargaris cristalligena TaxID=215637 RepID=A0A4P9ZVM4_9FUNG|nr:serine incorporator/TMS membrane protein [Dimargaris cristalligena]|eukprot:RKP37686.1 serine incorporator/TMS membrane protein [Dimargaris cristalligena]